MTTRELIAELLDAPMNAEVLISATLADVDGPRELDIDKVLWNLGTRGWANTIVTLEASS